MRAYKKKKRLTGMSVRITSEKYGTDSEAKLGVKLALRVKSDLQENRDRKPMHALFNFAFCHQEHSFGFSMSPIAPISHQLGNCSVKTTVKYNLVGSDASPSPLPEKWTGAVETPERKIRPKSH